MYRTLLKKPSAWIPIVLSLGVFVAILITLAVSGTPVHQTDEGTAAHLFQIWLGIETILIGFFGMKWLPKNIRPASLILAIQIIAVLIACSPVRYFNL